MARVELPERVDDGATNDRGVEERSRLTPRPMAADVRQAAASAERRPFEVGASPARSDAFGATAGPVATGATGAPTALFMEILFVFMAVSRASCLGENLELPDVLDDGAQREATG